MSSEFAIEVRGLGKRYPLFRRSFDRLRQALGMAIPAGEAFTALDDISFAVRRGTTVGIIGHNGSGKSTLLQILCGTLQPSAGSVEVRGRISALLELGAGFNPDFSGLDNVLMLGAIMGFSPAEMQVRLPEIEAFADIGDFFRQPVKSYSSGMFVRLAFAAAIHADPDILIVDEALAVGDIAFQHKCMNRMRQFMQRGTLLLVSHDLNAITSLCDEVIWLDHGRIREVGPPKDVAEHYWAAMYGAINQATDSGTEGAFKPFAAAPEAGLAHLRNLEEGAGSGFGSGRARIVGVQVCNTAGEPTGEIGGGSEIAVTVTAEALAPIASPIIGLAFKNLLGNVVTGTNTDFERAALRPLAAGELRTVRFTLQLPELAEGSYALTVAVADGTEDTHHMLHWIDDAALLKIVPPRPVMGAVRVPARVEVST